MGEGSAHLGCYLSWDIVGMGEVVLLGLRIRMHGYDPCEWHESLICLFRYSVMACRRWHGGDELAQQSGYVMTNSVFYQNLDLHIPRSINLAETARMR